MGGANVGSTLGTVYLNGHIDSLNITVPITVDLLPDNGPDYLLGNNFLAEVPLSICRRANHFEIAERVGDEHVHLRRWPPQISLTERKPEPGEVKRIYIYRSIRLEEHPLRKSCASPC